MGELTRIIQFRVTKGLANRLDAIAQERHVKRSEIIRIACFSYVNDLDAIRRLTADCDDAGRGAETEMIDD